MFSEGIKSASEMTSADFSRYCSKSNQLSTYALTLFRHKATVDGVNVAVGEFIIFYIDLYSNLCCIVVIVLAPSTYTMTLVTAGFHRRTPNLGEFRRAQMLLMAISSVTKTRVPYVTT